jgi:hypothetical protein
MLKLGRALAACGISQKELAAAIGWSRPLVSRVLSTGQLPSKPLDEQRFRDNVARFAKEDARMWAWCVSHNVQRANLLEEEPGGSASAKASDGKPDGSAGEELDLPAGGWLEHAEGQIVFLAGEAVISGPELEKTLCLAKTAAYLLETLRDQPLSMDALGEIEVEVNRLLSGAFAWE